jgi:hypothetical protein
MYFASPSAIQVALERQSFTSWTPSYSAGSGSLTSVTTNEAVYLDRGVDTEFYVDITITNAGTAGADFRFTLPTTPAQADVFVGMTTVGTILQAVTGTESDNCFVLLKNNSTMIATGVRFTLRGRYRNT